MKVLEKISHRSQEKLILPFLKKCFENKKCSYEWYLAIVFILCGVLFVASHCYIGKCGTLTSKNKDGLIAYIVHPFISGALSFVLWEVFKTMLNNIEKFINPKDYDLCDILLLISPLFYIYALNNMSFIGIEIFFFLLGSISISEVSKLTKSSIEKHNSQLSLK